MDLTGLVVEQSSFLSNGFMQTMEHAFEQAHISVAHLCFIVLGIITLLPSFFYNYNNHSRQKSAKYYINDHDALENTLRYSIAMVVLFICWCLLSISHYLNVITALVLIGVAWILTLQPWEALQRSRQLVPHLTPSEHRITLISDTILISSFLLSIISIGALGNYKMGHGFMVSATLSMLSSCVLRGRRIKFLWMFYRKHTQNI